ncbi:MAG: oligosaccharide flippase family protein, partial [Nitrospira sp.]
MNLNDHLRKSISWLACSKVVVQGISLLSTLTVARLLTPDNYGVMALSAFWTSSLLVVSELGAGAAVIQFQNLKKQELNILFGFTTSLSLLG